MPAKPIYLRWENTSPPHNKFYELEIELSLFFPKKLTRRWGRIGGPRPRALHMLVAEEAELDRMVDQVSRRRGYHGYHLVDALYSSAVEGMAA